MPLRVFGLTGGIGMGKSAAGELLRQRSVPIVDTDTLAREVVRPGQPALEEIRRVFGEEFLESTGELRREELARVVFADTTAREKLESITHPRIRELWKQQVQAWRDEGRSAVAVIIPLLFETHAQSEFDATICIACSTTTQRERLTLRGWSPHEIESRIAAQLPIEEKMARANYVAWSEGGLDLLNEQLGRILGR